MCLVKISGGLSHVRRHEKTKNHIKCYQTVRSTPSIKDNIIKKDSNDIIKNPVKEAELKLVVFLAEHNLPFSLMHNLPLLCASAFPDSKIAAKVMMKRKKATQILTGIIGPENKNELIEDLKNNYFSIIIDETNDISTVKCLVILTRYLKNGSIMDRFYDVLHVKSCSAEDLFNSICSSFKESNVPLKNIIGLAADNCAVMMGNIKSVKTLFQKVNKNIVVVGCTCHSFHLCASYACKKLPQCLEQFTHDIYNYISGSSKRYEEFKNCEIFANEKPHTLLKPSQTRWLSLQAVVNRILDHWNSLELFFKKAISVDNIQTCHNIFNAFRNPIFRLYFFFLSYVLEIINKLNLEFQAEGTKIHVLLSRVSALYKMILKSFLKKKLYGQH